MKLYIKIKLVFILVSFTILINSCSTKKSDLEICFGKVEEHIGNDSIVSEIKKSSIGEYGKFIQIIETAVNEEKKNGSICFEAIHTFQLKNKQNSATVNNLILFQYFQAFLNQKNFDIITAKDSALRFEAEWKGSGIDGWERQKAQAAESQEQRN